METDQEYPDTDQWPICPSKGRSLKGSGRGFRRDRCCSGWQLYISFEGVHRVVHYHTGGQMRGYCRAREEFLIGAQRLVRGAGDR